jgi:serine/threonine protein kinase
LEVPVSHIIGEFHGSASSPLTEQKKYVGIVDMSKNNDTGVAIVPRGTSQYSSPELLKGNPKLNVAVDLWSLGCVFYAFFNNESPFHAETESLTVQAIMEYSISGDKRSVCPSEYNFAHKWSKYIDGLLQHRLQIWKDLIMDSRDWEKPPDGLLLPEASWQEEVESTELKDGSLGWAMFEL